MEFMDYIKALINFIMKLVALFKNEDKDKDEEEAK